MLGFTTSKKSTNLIFYPNFENTINFYFVKKGCLNY